MAKTFDSDVPGISTFWPGSLLKKVNQACLGKCLLFNLPQEEKFFPLFCFPCFTPFHRLRREIELAEKLQNVKGHVLLTLKSHHDQFYSFLSA